MIKSGVYGIYDTVKGRAYYGSSINVFNRWKRHKWELNKGVHCNKFLQNAWVKYGEHKFDWAFLEPVEDINMLRQREQIWLDISVKAVGVPGTIYNSVLEVVDANLFNRKQGVYTEERKLKHSEMMKGNKFALGKIHSHNTEIRKQISEKLKGTRHSVESSKQQGLSMRKYRPSISNIDSFTTKYLNNSQIIEIINKYNNGETARSLAKLFKVGNHIINSVVKNSSIVK